MSVVETAGRSSGAAFGSTVWSGPETASPAEERLVRELGLSPLLARLLVQRGLREPEGASTFLRPTLSQNLRSPMLFHEMRPAAGRLLEAVRLRQPVVIYGDYDVDGITGTAELLLFLRELGAEPRPYMPNRLREGYGLRSEALREIAARGAKLVVTVDCGAAAHDEITVARNLGLDLIVCDHHQAPDVRPPAFAVLNPVVADAGFPFAGLCAAGVVFYLLMGTRMLLREAGERGPDLRRYLDLVALGTVADLVPLLEENRVLVKYGLREIGSRRRPGIEALLDVSRVTAVTAGALGFALGPRLNASGRLADAARAVDLLASRDPDTARRLAASLDTHNYDRRALEHAMLEEAERQIRSIPDATRHRSFVLASEGWHPGVVGIVASRLVERYHRPTILLAVENGTCRGSARGIPAVHLFETLRACAPLLDRFGGHRMAAGLTLRQDRLAEFRDRFESVVTAATSQADFHPTIRVDADVRIEDVSAAMVDDLARLEPHGSGNPRPVLRARSVPVAAVRAVGERHLRIDVRAGESGRIVETIGFRMAERAAEIGSSIDILFCPEIRSWDGRERLQLVLRDFRKAELNQ